MVFEKILKILLSHPQFGPQMINKIADSWPIRKAAKLAASAYLRGKHAIEEQQKDPQVRAKLSNFDVGRFKQKFTEELKKEWDRTKSEKRKK